MGLTSRRRSRPTSPRRKSSTGQQSANQCCKLFLKIDSSFPFTMRCSKRQVYSLVTVKTNGRLGPRLRRSSGADCDNARASEPSGRIAAGSLPRCGSYVLEFANGHFTIRARFITMEAVAMNMRNLVDRVVLAPWAPTGMYSFDLDFNPGAPAV